MRQKAVLYSILFVGLITCVRGAISFASADPPLESAGTAPTPEQISVRYPDAAGQVSLESGALITYTWSTVAHPYTYTLMSVDMVSANDGWAVGYFDRSAGTPYGGVILRWDGLIWDDWWSSSSGSPLFSVAMGSAGDGWAVGSGGETSHWDGSDWNSVDNPSGQRLNSVAMVSEDDGWAVGGSGSCGPTSSLEGVIVRWDGSTWSQWGSDIPDVILRSVAMVSTDDGWAVGNYCHFVMPSPSVNSVIMHWNGSNWNAVSSPTYQTLYSVAMVSATDGWAVGDNGVTLHWNGSEWSEVSSPTTCELNSVAMVSTDDGWAVGGDGYFSSQPSVILHWDGSTWSEVESPVSETLNSVTMLSGQDGWAVGDGGTILHYTSLDKMVRVVGAGTADYDWNWKNQFNPGDPIRWFIKIVNDTGGDAQIELTYDAKGPNNETVLYEQYTDTIPAGRWYWGYDGTVPEGMGGTHTFTGSGLYLGTTSQAVFTYTVTGSKVFLPLVLKSPAVNPTGVLAWPIDCIPGETCSNIIGYPDIDNDGVAFNCGQPGYPGHEGTDIGITWEQMDNGVSVFAAAAGQVLWVFDGKYDRCPGSHPDCQPSGYTVCTEEGNYCGTGSCCCYWCFDGGNVIVIRHFGVNGVFATRYDHLRTNSILVSPGEFVSKGQKIAEVGSAGTSTSPHLHFEVWGTGFYELADPWAGSCGPNFDSPLWYYQIPWAGSGSIPVYAPGFPLQRYEVSSTNENPCVYLPTR